MKEYQATPVAQHRRRGFISLTKWTRLARKYIHLNLKNLFPQGGINVDIMEYDGKKYDKGALDDFLVKSKELQPRCFGAYNKDDLVCQQYCARSVKGDAEDRARALRIKLNEQYASLLCFIYPWAPFCKDVRDEMESKKAIIEVELAELDDKRGKRDKYWLFTDAHPGLPRLPVGPIQEIEVFHDFTREAALHLETKGVGGCGFSWAIHSEEVIARLWREKEYDFHLAFIKSITPALPDQNWSYPINVTQQEEDENGDLILSAKINIKKTGVIDYYRVDGTELTIIVIGSSAKTNMKVDEVGPIFHDRRY